MGGHRIDDHRHVLNRAGVWQLPRRHVIGCCSRLRGRVSKRRAMQHSFQSRLRDVGTAAAAVAAAAVYRRLQSEPALVGSVSPTITPSSATVYELQLLLMRFSRHNEWACVARFAPSLRRRKLMPTDSGIGDLQFNASRHACIAGHHATSHRGMPPTLDIKSPRLSQPVEPSARNVPRALYERWIVVAISKRKSILFDINFIQYAVQPWL